MCGAFPDEGVLELLRIFDRSPSDLVESELRVLLCILVYCFRFICYLLKLRHRLWRKLGLYTRHNYDHFSDISHITWFVSIHEVALFSAHLRHLES